MKILAIAMVEDATNINRQIAKQTIQPNRTIITIDPEPADDINARRERIAQNHQKLVDTVKRVDCDLVWQLEGDCELPEDCLERLLADYEILKTTPDFGYISGIQVGRHGLYCLGAWKNFTDDSFESLDYTLKGVQPVEATGFYCLLAEKETWLSGKCSWQGEPYGPDVVWSRSLKKNIYCDMDLEIGHIIKSGTIYPHHMSTCQARFYLQDGKWEYEQLN